MTPKRCPRCGVSLKIVKGRWFCPNHGWIDEDENNKKGDTSYVG